MKKLYLRKMGMDDNNLLDIKNHRVRVIDWINTNTHGPMFFEFMQFDHWHYRTTHKITGKQLKKPVRELLKANSIHIDTEFVEIQNDGSKNYYRDSKTEKAVFDELLDFNRAAILHIINKYTVEHFDKVVFIDEEARKIINTFGGYRELSILDQDPVFTIGNTWNNEHKTVKIYSRVNHNLDKSCEVDLITWKITG